MALIDATQAAAILGISRGAVYELAKLAAAVGKIGRKA